MSDRGPTPISFDQTFDQGAQRDWPDGDLFEQNPPPRQGYNPPPNPPPGPPPPRQQYMPPAGVMPPIDPFQSGFDIPPPMPLPSRRYVSPHQLPSWNAGASFGSVPVLGESGPISPLLSMGAGGVVGYLFGGWKGMLGTSLVVMGANNLGLVTTDKPVMRLFAAAVGLGVGGYFIQAARGKVTIPNPPKWLRRVEDD